MKRSFRHLAFKSTLDRRLLSTDVLLSQLFALPRHFNDFSVKVLCLYLIKLVHWHPTFNNLKETFQT